jgi:hypothetical protein
MTIEQLQVLQLANSFNSNISNYWCDKNESLKYNGIPSPCETFPYGQVEDYTVIIDGAAFNAVNSTSANDNSGFDFTLSEPNI